MFQFYIYQDQDQILRPMPVWFMGDEAWRRWREYDEGARWHAKQWASEKHLENPVKSKSYKSVSEDTLRKERYRMSRISGANYCGANMVIHLMILRMLCVQHVRLKKTALCYTVIRIRMGKTCFKHCRIYP